MICFPFFSSDVGTPKTEPRSGLWGQGKVTTAGQVEGRKDTARRSHHWREKVKGKSFEDPGAELHEGRTA